MMIMCNHLRTHLWVWNAASEVLDELRQDMLARAFIDGDIRRNSKIDGPGACRRRIDIDFKEPDGGRDWRKTGVCKGLAASVVRETNSDQCLSKWVG